MSNSRMFCVAFLVTAGLLSLANALFGIESRHTGVDLIVRKFALCSTIGISWVAIFGDRLDKGVKLP